MVLIFWALVASANAIDIWDGSNNRVHSGSGSVDGVNGISFIDDSVTGVLSAGLEANAELVGGGDAYADWNVPRTVISRLRITNGDLHVLTIEFGGHVQTGIEGNGVGDASARIFATATSTAAADTGTAIIRSQLQMDGMTSGYAIADGESAFSASAVSGPLFEAKGAATGKVDIRGATATAASSMAAGAQIESMAAAGSAAGTDTTQSNIKTDEFGPYKPVQIGTAGDCGTTGDPHYGTSIDVTNGDTYGTASSSPNQFAKTKVTNTISATMTTWNNDMAEITDAGISAFASTVSTPKASTDVRSSVKIQRVVSDPTNKVTAEAFVRGGSWNAEANSVLAKGALGGVFDGIASGAHLTSSSGTTTNPIPIYSGQELIQTALFNSLPTAVLDKQTAADHAIEGPAFTGNINDDAGSYFSTTGYTTTTNVPPDVVVGPSWDIKWLNGNDVVYNTVTNLPSIPIPGGFNPRWIDFKYIP
jgi:hypothetical protein